MRQLRELSARRCLDPAKPGCPIGAADVHAIQEQHVKMDVVQRRAKPLDEGDRAGLGRLVLNESIKERALRAVAPVHPRGNTRTGVPASREVC